MAIRSPGCWPFRDIGSFHRAVILSSYFILSLSTPASPHPYWFFCNPLVLKAEKLHSLSPVDIISFKMQEHTFYIPIIHFEHSLRKSYDLGHQFTLMPFPDDLEKEYRLFGHGYFKRRYGDELIKERRIDFIYSLENDLIKLNKPPKIVVECIS